MIPRIRTVRLAPRAAILFLIAILLPCIVLAGLTLRLMTLQRELAESRHADARTALIATIRTELSAELQRLKLQAVTRGPGAAAGGAADGAVVLVASIENGRMRLPWALRTAPTRTIEGAYADAMRSGEQVEYRSGGADEALAAYRLALVKADSPVQAALARLGMSRTLQASGRTREAAAQDRQLLETPLSIRDDDGTPLALYAAGRQLARRSDSDIDYRSIADMLEGSRSDQPPWAPSALYMVRDLANAIARHAPDESLRARAQQLAVHAVTLGREREQAESLASVLPVPVPAPGSDAPWVLFGPTGMQWLVTATGTGQDRLPVVVAVRLVTFTQNVEAIPLLHGNGVRLVAAGAGVEPLGNTVPGLGLVLTVPESESVASEEQLQRRFYVAALVLVIGTAWCGGYLFWHHVQRDLRIAELRSQFVSSVSHELKTPLTSIRLFAETLLLGRTARADTRDEYLETIVNESERLTRLINNVLDFSKIEQGTKTYRLAPHSLVEIIEASARVVEYPLLQEGFELRRSLDLTIPPIMVDRDAMQQAILNLLSNAMKYSGTSRTIELTLSATDQEVFLGVADGGHGIAPAEQRRVFQKFYRSVSTEHHHIPGTGLGLTIVEHVAAAHGGRVTVTSALGLGSTFSIVLPLTAAARTARPGCALDSAHATHSGH